MRLADALRDIKGYARAGRLVFTRHALRRMDERNAGKGDVLHALLSATSCFAQPDGTWRVPSADSDGDRLTVIVALKDGGVVVTLF